MIITYIIIYYFILLALYIFSTPLIRERLLDIQIDIPEIVVLLMYLGTTIAVIFKFRIYIFNIEINDDNELIIKYQKYNTVKQVKANLCNTKIEYIPAGKNNPYIRFTIYNKKNQIILKQKKIKKWEIKVLEQFVKDINLLKKRTCK